MNDIDWQCHPFDELTTTQLYAVLALRSEVFVIEQACIFQDMDGFDGQAVHVLGIANGILVAYARCFNAGIKFDEASIGRVATRRSARGSGAGHAVMEKSIACVFHQWGPQTIRISAQAHLKAFYCQHGFGKSGRMYCEDGINHIEMLRSV